jgi:hypothetical protein
MIKNINMFVKIVCDKCGFSQTELEPESNDKFFKTGWSVNPNAKKYIHKCGKCNGKNSPVKIWDKVEPLLKKHPLIGSITKGASNSSQG